MPAAAAISAVLSPVRAIAMRICPEVIMVLLYDKSYTVSSFVSSVLDKSYTASNNEHSKGDRPTTNLNDHPPTHTMTKETGIMSNPNTTVLVAQINMCYTPFNRQPFYYWEPASEVNAQNQQSVCWDYDPISGDDFDAEACPVLFGETVA